MTTRYKGKITFSIDKGHPDIKYVLDWEENKLYTFEDTYTFLLDCHTKEEIESYIKHDLMLVAGGGYATSHIHNIEFEIKQI